MNGPEAYLIWSIDHQAWWRPAETGYSESLAGAGAYRPEDAERILATANRVAVKEIAVPVGSAGADIIAERLTGLIEARFVKDAASLRMMLYIFTEKLAQIVARADLLGRGELYADVVGFLLDIKGGALEDVGQGFEGLSGTVLAGETETLRGETMTKPDQDLPGSARPDNSLPDSPDAHNEFAKKVATAMSAIHAVSEGPATSDNRRDALIELGRYAAKLAGEVVEINAPPEPEPR